MTLSKRALDAASFSLVLLTAMLARTTAAQAQGAPAAAQAATVLCASAGSERQHCPADTSGGIALLRATGSSPCLLGRNWGYDDAGVWVAEGCGGEFMLGQSTRVPTPPPAQAVAAAPASAPGRSYRARRCLRRPPRRRPRTSPWSSKSRPAMKSAADRTDRNLERLRAGHRLSDRAHEARRAGDQRLRHGALPQPERRRSGLHRPSGQRTAGRSAGTTSTPTASWSSSRGGWWIRSWSTRSRSGR